MKKLLLLSGLLALAPGYGEGHKHQVVVAWAQQARTVATNNETGVSTYGWGGAFIYNFTSTDVALQFSWSTNIGEQTPESVGIQMCLDQGYHVNVHADGLSFDAWK